MKYRVIKVTESCGITSYTHYEIQYQYTWFPVWWFTVPDVMSDESPCEFSNLQEAENFVNYLVEKRIKEMETRAQLKKKWTKTKEVITYRLVPAGPKPPY